MYTVKSGYEIARRFTDADTRFSLQLPSDNLLKAHVWKLPAPNKLRQFLWQSLAGAVAVNERLNFRHIRDSASCPRCGGQEETINHALFTCPHAKETWALSGIPTRAIQFPSESLRTNFDTLFWRLSHSDALSEIVQAIPWIIWYIWKARNDKVFNSVASAPSETMAMAITESREWFQANISNHAAETHTRLDPTTSPATFMCFVDGSWKYEYRTSGVGWVLQLQDGTTDLLGLQGHHMSLSPLHTELHGLIWAMRCLMRKNRYCTTFVTNSTELVRMVESPQEWPGFQPELRDLAILRDSFPEFELIYRQRENNKRADLLARNARTRDTMFSYISTSVPYWFSDTENVFA